MLRCIFCCYLLNASGEANNSSVDDCGESRPTAYKMCNITHNHYAEYTTLLLYIFHGIVYVF